MFNTKGAAVVVVIMAHGSCVLGRVCVFHTFLAAGGKISEAVFIRPRTTNPVERGPTRPTAGVFVVCAWARVGVRVSGASASVCLCGHHWASPGLVVPRGVRWL